MDGSPGRIITKASAQDKITVKIIGKAAHAGLNPENGISALKVASYAIENMNLSLIKYFRHEEFVWMDAGGTAGLDGRCVV